MRMLLKTGLLWIGRALRLGGLVAVWNALVVGAVATAYHVQLGFDALDPANWRSLYAYYLDGAVLDFRYLEIAGYGGLAAIFGSLGLAVRSRTIWEHMPSLTAFLPDTRLMRRPPSTAKRSTSRPAGARGRSWGAGLTGMAGRIRSSRRGSADRPATADRRAEPTVDPIAMQPSVAQFPVPPPSTTEAPEPPPSEAVGSGEAGPDSAGGPWSSGSGETETLEVGEAAPNRNAVGPTGEEDDDETSDFAILSRAVALVEVWSSPPPEWMVLALRDELEQLSVEGWKMLQAFEAAALDLIDVIDDLNLLPEDADAAAAFQTVRDAVFAEYRPPPEPVDEGFGPPVMAPQDPATEVALPAGGRARQGMTLCASWFYEVIENFLMLEELRSGANALPPEVFEQEWGGVLTETLEQLTLAQRSMTEADWGSLDQYPDRAQRARVLVDRLVGDQLLPRTAQDDDTAEPDARLPDGGWNAGVAGPATLDMPDLAPVEETDPRELEVPSSDEVDPRAKADQKGNPADGLFPAMPDLPSADTFFRFPAQSAQSIQSGQSIQSAESVEPAEAAPSAPTGGWPGVESIDADMAGAPADVAPLAEGSAPFDANSTPVPRPAGPVSRRGGASDVPAFLRAQGYSVMPYGMAPGYSMARRDSSVVIVRLLDLGGRSLGPEEDGREESDEKNPLGPAVAGMDRVVRLARAVSARSASVRGIVVLVNGTVEPAVADTGSGTNDIVVCAAEPGLGPFPLLQDIVAEPRTGAPRVVGAV